MLFDGCCLASVFLKKRNFRVGVDWRLLFEVIFVACVCSFIALCCSLFVICCLYVAGDLCVV